MFSVNLHNNQKHEFLDITDQVNKLSMEHGKDKSACVIFAPHTTGAIVVNENADPDVSLDIIMGVNRLVPDYMEFKHMEGNSDAHLKASLLGASEIIPLQDGKLALGTWQGVFFAEFDGPRSRTVLVTFL